MMEIILTQDVQALGKAGQRITVKDGYARNFLIPRGRAVPASPGAGSAAEVRRNTLIRSAEWAKAKAEELARKLAGAACGFAVSVGDQGKLHGAVTASDIVRELGRQGIPLEKHQIQLDRSLTQLGEHPVPVRLHPDVKASVRVILTKA